MEEEQRPVAFIILPRTMFASREEREGIPQEIYEAAVTAGYDPLLDDPARPGSGNIATNLVRDIVKSQMVLVDLTGFDHYVLHALGIAMALRERVLLLFQGENSELPVSLRGEYCISYRNNAASLRELRTRLQEALQRAAEGQQESASNTIYSALPEYMRAALSAPDELTSVSSLLDKQKEMQDAFEKKLDLIRGEFLEQLGMLHQSMGQSAQIDTSLLDKKINELRASLDEMERKRNEAEYYMHRLEHERDTMLTQVAQVSVILEEQRSTIPYPRTLPDNAELVFVPAGLIIPGGRRVSEEEHQRDQRFVRSFYLDKYPVTNTQFARFVKATGYETVAEQLNREQGRDDPTWRTPAGAGSTLEQRGDHPVVWVYREDALRYAKWAGRRLPTRLEWERAMRGLDGHTWPWGDEWRDHACNLNSTGTTPVNAFPSGSSPVGALDMVGNVWEWLTDELAGGKLMLMGGSWAEPGMNVGYKVLVVPGDGTDGATGFRCAMDVPSYGSDE